MDQDNVHNFFLCFLVLNPPLSLNLLDPTHCTFNLFPKVKAKYLIYFKKSIINNTYK